MLPHKISKAEKKAKEAGYEDEIFWVACGEKTDLQAGWDVQHILSQTATRGFYSGATQFPLRRWTGGFVREVWMTGHRYGWVGDEDWLAKAPGKAGGVAFYILAVRLGADGAHLERYLIDLFWFCRGTPRICNKCRDARGTSTKADVVNFIYLCRW